MNIGPQTTSPSFTFQMLSQYFELHERLTNTKPTSIVVSPECLAWYREQVKQVVKNFNIPTTKNYKKDEFMGVELLSKENDEKHEDV